MRSAKKGFIVAVSLIVLVGVWGGAITIEQALDTNRSGSLDDIEVLQALNLWIKQLPVPTTDGLVISDLAMLALLQLWITQNPIGTPPPPQPPPQPAGKACPEAAPTARVLRVPSDFPTIQQAIDNASDGDKVVIKPGTYGGGIVITKSLFFESQEGPAVTRIVSLASQRGIQVVRAAGVVIRGFSISGGKAGLGLEGSSDVCVEQNEIFSNVGPGIEIFGRLIELGQRAHSVLIVNNVIRNNLGYGIVAHELERSQIVKNQIIDTETYPDGRAGEGIAVLGGSRVKIQGNAIVRAHARGIFASGVTDLEIAANEVRDIPTAPGRTPPQGIAIGEGTVGAFVLGNSISEADIGLSIERMRSITVRDNTISRSRLAGIQIDSTLLARLEGNTVSETQPRAMIGGDLAIGVRILNESTVALVGIAIRSSFGYGLWVENGAEVEVTESVIAQTAGKPGVPGRGVGVKNAAMTISGSTISQHADDGVAVLSGGQATLSDNTIVGNGGAGILVETSGMVSCPAPNALEDNGTDVLGDVPATCGQ